MNPYQQQDSQSLQSQQFISQEQHSQQRISRTEHTVSRQVTQQRGQLENAAHVAPYTGEIYETGAHFDRQISEICVRLCTYFDSG